MAVSQLHIHRSGIMPHRHSNFLLIAACSLFLVCASCGSEETDSTSPPVPAKTAKIMPLGDSITESAAGMPTYRYFLWQLAQEAGYRIDFVGSQSGAFGGPPSNQDFDMDHEGHWGWRADQILARIVDWAMAAAPDIVLIHLGHNDLCQDQDIAGTIGDVAAIIDALRTVNAKVGIIVAQNIASSFPCQARIPAYNDQVPALVAEKATEESPVAIVDQYTGFNPATMTWDGQHPNASGESRMADRWFTVLVPLLDAFIAGPEVSHQHIPLN
jgi:lysophospholipase L1-like esterase